MFNALNRTLRSLAIRGLTAAANALFAPLLRQPKLRPAPIRRPRIIDGEYRRIER